MKIYSQEQFGQKVKQCLIGGQLKLILESVEEVELVLMAWYIYTIHYCYHNLF